MYSFPLLPIGRGEVLGVRAVLCERPAAGVLDGPPGWTDVTWVAPALVVDVGGRRSTGEGDRFYAPAWGCVLLSGEGGGLAEAESPV